MNHSESIDQISAALATAQAAFQPVKKSRKNPHLGNEYATLDDVITAIKDALGKNGIAFLQPLTSTEAGVALETVLIHTSGQWLSTSAVIPTLAGNRGVNELQAFGGALTYMRRYMLAAMLGVSSDDDEDGNGDRKDAKPAKKQQESQPGTMTHADAAKLNTWAKNNALSGSDVMAALGVTKLSEFPGNYAAAVAKIGKWIHEQIAAGKRQATAPQAIEEVTP
jgi:hypothetical protein